MVGIKEETHNLTLISPTKRGPRLTNFGETTYMENNNLLSIGN